MYTIHYTHGIHYTLHTMYIIHYTQGHIDENTQGIHYNTRISIT